MSINSFANECPAPVNQLVAYEYKWMRRPPSTYSIYKTDNVLRMTRLHRVILRWQHHTYSCLEMNSDDTIREASQSNRHKRTKRHEMRQKTLPRTKDKSKCHSSPHPWSWPWAPLTFPRIYSPLRPSENNCFLDPRCHVPFLGLVPFLWMRSLSRWILGREVGQRQLGPRSLQFLVTSTVFSQVERYPRLKVSWNDDMWC